MSYMSSGFPFSSFQSHLNESDPDSIPNLAREDGKKGEVANLVARYLAQRDDRSIRAI